MLAVWALALVAALTLFLFRDRIFLLAARSVGLEECSAERFTWRACRRLKLVLRKGHLQHIHLESAELLLPPAGQSFPLALIQLIRLVLAVALGGAWAKPGRRPLAVLRLQGLELKLRGRKPLVRREESDGGTGDASTHPGSESEGGSSGQETSPRVSSDEGNEGPATNAGGKAWRRRRSRGSGGAIALPAPLLRLLPLLRIELDGATVQSASDAVPSTAIGPTEPWVGQVRDATTHLSWEARLTKLTVGASFKRSATASSTDDVGVTNTGAEDVWLHGSRDGNASVDGSSAHPDGREAAKAGAARMTGAARAAAIGTPRNDGDDRAAASEGLDNPASSSGHRLPKQKQTDGIVTVVFGLAGLEAKVRQAPAPVNQATMGGSAPATNVAPGGDVPEASMDSVVAESLAMLAAGCDGLTVTAAFGRGRRPGSKSGTLMSIGADVKQVQVDCRTVPEANLGGSSVGPSSVAEARDPAAVAAGAVADSPLLTALAAVLTAATARAASPSCKRGQSADPVAFRAQRTNVKQVDQELGQHLGPHLDPDLAERVAAGLCKLAVVLPDKVYLRLAGLRIAAAVGVALHGHDGGGSGGGSPDRSAVAASAAATVQLIIGGSSVDVSSLGAAVQLESGSGAGVYAGRASASQTLLDVSVRLGSMAMRAAAAGPVALAAAAPVYFGLQHLGLRARAEMSPLAVTALQPDRSAGNGAGAAMFRYNLSLHVDVPASVLQVRPQMLLPCGVSCTQSGDVGVGCERSAPLTAGASRVAAAADSRHDSTGAQLLSATSPQPGCYSLVLRGFAGNGSCGFSAPAGSAVLPGGASNIAGDGHGPAEGGTQTVGAAAGHEHSPPSQLRRQLQMRSGSGAADVEEMAAAAIAAATGQPDVPVSTSDPTAGDVSTAGLSPVDAWPPGQEDGDAAAAAGPASLVDAAVDAAAVQPQSAAPTAAPSPEKKAGQAASSSNASPGRDVAQPAVVPTAVPEPKDERSSAGMEAGPQRIPGTAAAAAEAVAAAPTMGPTPDSTAQKPAAASPSEKTIAGVSRVPVAADARAWLLISLQGLECFGSEADTAAYTEAATMPGSAAASSTEYSAPKPGWRYDIVLLQRTTLNAALTADAPPQPPTGTARAAHNPARVPGPEHPADSAFVDMDVAVVLGRLDVTLDPRRLTPLLKLAGHAKAAAAASSRLAAAAKAAAASAAAARAAAATAAGRRGMASSIAGMASLLPTSLLQSDAYAFPQDVLSPDGISALERGGAGEARSVSGGGLAGGDAIGGQVGLARRHRRGRRRLGAQLKVRCLTVDSPSGIRLSLQADMPLGVSSGTVHHSDKPAGAGSLPTTLEATIGSVSLAAWPGGSAAAGTDQTVVEAFAGAVSLTAIQAVQTASVLRSAGPPTPALAASSERQQVLRVDRLKVLFAGGAAPPPAPDPRAIAPTATATVAAPVPAPQQPSALRKGDLPSQARVDGGSPAKVASAPATPVRRNLLRFDVTGTRGSFDMDLILAGLASAQAVADAAAAWKAQQRPLVPLTAAAAVADPSSVSDSQLPHSKASGERGSLGRKPEPLVEIRAADTELAVTLGAAEVVKFGAAEARGSSGLRAGSVDALAVRVNGRRLLDVEYLTAGAAEPPVPGPTSAGNATGEQVAGFTAEAASPGHRTVPSGAHAGRFSAGSGSGGSRHVSRSSAEFEGWATDGLPATTSSAAQQPSRNPPQQQQQQPAGRRHHRRHGSSAAGSGNFPSAGPAGDGMRTLPQPPRPAAATLQPWVTLGPPPAWVAATGQQPGAGAAGTAGVGGAAGYTTRRPATAKGVPTRAGCDVRRRAARSRFEEAPDADAAAPLRVTSVDLALYGAVLTVAHDESAARVYVMTELWLRAVKQVLAPRIAHLKDTLRTLKQTYRSGSTGQAAAGGAAAVAQGGGGGGGARPDKAFVEILLNTRRLAVVIEHQPVEAWLALHGSALRATATQRHLYERLMSSHVGSYAARGRRDVAAAAAGASAAASTAQPVVPGPAGTYNVTHDLLDTATGWDDEPKHSLSRSSSSGSSSSRSTTSSSSISGTSSDSSIGSDEDGGLLSGLRRRKKRASREGRGPAAAAAGTADGTGCAARGAGELGAGAAVQDEWAQVMRDVAATYMAACRAVQAAAAANRGVPHVGASGGAASEKAVLAGCPGGALLHLSVSEAQAAVMVAPAGCNRGRKVAEAVILKVDSPASEGVTFERVVAISLAAAASDLKVCLAGCGGLSSPAATCAQAAVSGWIIRARQLAAPPRSSDVDWPVGRYLKAPVATPVRFSRPNMKTYTDLRIEADGLSAAFGTAMEPVLAQLAKAIKQRVVPPQPQLLQPNGSVSHSVTQHRSAAAAASEGGVLEPGPGPEAAAGSPSGLPPWDNIRYVWRGGLKVVIRGLNAVVAAASLDLPITAHDPRLALSASTLGVAFSTGLVDCTATGMALLGFARAPGRGPGEPLVTVPLISLPLLNACIHTTFKQRSPTPYAFPLLTVPPPEGAVQNPVDVPGLMRSSSWSMALDVSIVRDAVAHLNTSSGPAAAPTSAAAAWTTGMQPPASGPAQGQQPQQPLPQQQEQPSQPAMAAGALEGLARAYIGEMQVKFLLALVNGLAGGAPVPTRGSWKRRTFFDPPRPRPAAAPSFFEARKAGASSGPTTGGMGGGATAVAAGAVGGVGGGSLGTLLSRMDINVSADVLDILHDAQDPDDPSDLLCLRARNLRYSNAFAYAKEIRTILRSNGTIRNKLAAKPAVTALSVEAYDIRIFTPCSGGASGPGGSAAMASLGASAAAAAGVRRRLGHGGASCGGAEAGPAGDPWDGADPSAGPGFGAGLVATCECLRLRQADTSDAAASGGPPALAQPRPIRIVVQDVQVLCTTDARDAVIATTVHIIQAFSPLAGSRAAAAATAGVKHAGSELSAEQAGAEPGHGGTGPQELRARPPEQKLTDGAAGGGSASMAASGAAPHGLGDAAGAAVQPPAIVLQSRPSMTLPLQPASLPLLGVDPLAEPQVDPRVLADERTLVALLRQQNEARRAEAQRRRLERSGSSSTMSTTAATDPDLAVSQDSEDEDERERVLGNSLDPTDAPERESVDPENETAEGAATGSRTATAGQSAEHHSAAMRTLYEVEFVRVQVGLISEYYGSGACLVLGADSAVLRGGRTMGAAPAAAGSAGPAPAGSAGPMAGSLKVLTFEVETLQAYAARHEQPRDPSLAAYMTGVGAGATAVLPGSAGPVRPSFSPLTDGLAASASAAAVAAAAVAANTVPTVPARLNDAGLGPGSAASLSGSAGRAPVVWLQVVHGQLVPYGASLPQDAIASGSAPAAQSPRCVMQKILNPFRIHLTSSRPWMPPPWSVDTPAMVPPPQQGRTPQQQTPRLQLPSGRGPEGVPGGGGSAGGNGLKLDIDVPAITGQMESWQFQLLLAVINETLAAPLPKVVMLTRGSGGVPLPAVESSPDVAKAAATVLSIKHRLRCIQYESLTLANYLTHGSAGFHDPYPVLAVAGPVLQSQLLVPGDLSQQHAGPYTATLFKPALHHSRPAAHSGIVTSGCVNVARGILAAGTAVPDTVLAQALLAPRPTGLNAVQLAALMRRNQELLLHWVVEQVSGAQDSLEAAAAVLVKLRSEVAAALEAQQHQRRKQATAVAVRLGRFGWALVNKDGAPFVQAELKGLSFHHSLDRDHTGTTKILMHAADMWELRSAGGISGAAGTTPVGAPGAGQGAGSAAPKEGYVSPSAPSATLTGGSETSGRGIATGGAATAGGGAGGGSCIGNSSSSSTILSLWRPDSSSSWDDDPLLRMYVVHGGVDAQYVTYEHIEVYLHPLQVRLTYALALVLADYFELRDDDREEGAARDDDSTKAGRREKSKGSGTARGGESGAATGGGGSTYTSPAKTGRSGGGGWFGRRSATALPDSSAAPSQAVHPQAGPLAAGAGIAQPSTAAAGTAAASASQSDWVSRTAVAGLTDARNPAGLLTASDLTSTAGPNAAGPAASPQRGRPPYYGAGGSAAASAAAVTAAKEFTGSSTARQSRGASAVADELTTAAAGGAPVRTVAEPPATDGAAVAISCTAATALAVRYGPTFRRHSDGHAVILVDVAGTLVPTGLLQPQQQATPATGRGGRDGASQGTAGGAGDRARAPRRLRFRHVRFNRIAARLTYTGPRLSIGSAGGWGLVIDARVYRDITGGWRDILKKYKWDLIRSVIKSVAGIQSGKLKELKGVGGGSGAAAATNLLTADPSGLSLPAGLSLEDLDPDITFTADGHALSAVTGASGRDGAGGGGGGALALGGQRAAALLGGVKKRAAAFMSAGGAAGARLRLAATGKPAVRSTVGGTGPATGPGATFGLPVSPEELEAEENESQESADVLREMVRQDTAQEYERIKRAAAAAQARATRLAALVGDTPGVSPGGGAAATGIFSGGVAGGGGARGRLYRS